MIVSNAGSSIFDKDAFMQYRPKPSLAKFSKKTLNFGFSTDRVMQPISELDSGDNLREFSYTTME